MKNEPVVNLDLALEHGLNEEEYGKILEILGRTPTYTELGIFSVMWSEHCSYKNSLLQLKTLPREGERLLVKPGEENAGLIDIGEDLAVAFKIESHNHPSAVEPYRGVPPVWGELCVISLPWEPGPLRHSIHCALATCPIREIDIFLPEWSKE